MPGRTDWDKELEAHYYIYGAWKNIFMLFLLFGIAGSLIIHIPTFMTVVWGITTGTAAFSWYVMPVMLFLIAIAFMHFVLDKVTINSSTTINNPRYKNVRTFLNEYWRRNVIGNRIEYFLDKKGELDYHIFEKESAHDNICKNQYSIIFPIGGWFKGPEIYYNASLVSTSNADSGKIRVEESPWYRSGLKGYKLPGVKLLDSNGSKIHLHMKNALLFVNHAKWTIPSTLELIFEKMDTLGEDLKKFKESTIAGANKWSDALDVLSQTIRKIDGTKRFIRSKQAREIRGWLQKEYSKLGGGKIEIFDRT